LFGILEAGLRVGGYGYPTGFFVQQDGGRYATNERFGWRFFPRDLARPPQPCALSAKPAGVVRIFILGGSAAMGTPDPSFSFGSILDVMLRERFPDTRFEIVNAAMVAINSHAVREIARDCAAFDSDLFVVYMGNNEVIGPYGPGTVFQRWSPPLWMIRGGLWVGTTRVGQMLGRLAAFIPGGRKAPVAWRGLEMFMENTVAADDPRLDAVYERFRRNLGDICNCARRARAAVILSTVAVNLRDCAPFASLHRADLDPESLRRWNLAYGEGGGLQASNRLHEAIQQYETAAALDGRHAELQFRLGQCLLKENRAAEAQSRFEMARDLDALRFRADSRINSVLRDVAAGRRAVGVTLVDAERVLGQDGSEAGEDSMGELFHEHVHLTFDGNYRLAQAVAGQVCEALPRLCAEGRQGELPSRQRCAELLAYTPWDELRLSIDMAKMTSRPPFTNQFDHEARRAEALRRIEELRGLATTPQAMEAAWRAYETALAGRPDDAGLQLRFGQFAMYRGRFDSALELLQAASERLPWDGPMHNAFGVALSGLGRMDEAQEHFLDAVKLQPRNLDALNNLGLLLARRGRLDDAAAQYRKALAIDPDNAQTLANLGNLMAVRGLADEAIAHYSKSLKADPDNAQVCLSLGDALLAKSRVDEAAASYRRALQIDPRYAQAHNNLGLLLAGRGQVDEAIAHYRRALEINPEHAESHNNLGLALAKRGMVEEAIAHYRKALELNPRLASAHNNYGVALASSRGQMDEAIACFERALEIDPHYEGARQNLDRARSLQEK
jgi:tetratricopeptide (TPR) repeat protein